MYVDGTALAPRGAARQSHDEQHDAPPVITLRKHALILHPGVVVYSNGNRNRVTGVDELPPWAEVTRARLRYHASASGAKRAVGNSANFTSASFAYTRPRATGRSADAPRASTCLRVDVHDIHPHEANQGPVLRCEKKTTRSTQSLSLPSCLSPPAQCAHEPPSTGAVCAGWCGSLALGHRSRVMGLLAGLGSAVNFFRTLDSRLNAEPRQAVTSDHVAS